MKQEKPTPLVYKSNALVEASYRLSVLEQRILLSCMQQIIKNGGTASADIFYRVTAVDLAMLSGADDGNIYRQLENAATRLMRREVWVKETPDAQGKVFMRWVTTCKYLPGDGEIHLRFNVDILPHLNSLTKEFTRFAFSDVAKMSSAHAIRMYEMLAQYLSIGEREITIDEILDRLQLSQAYRAIKNLRPRVLDISVKQINELSSLNVSYTQNKKGRKIHSFTFKIAKKQDIDGVLSPMTTKDKASLMTDKQAALFASFLAEDAEFGSKYALPGEGFPQFTNRIKEQLLAPDGMKKYKKYLEKYGFVSS